MSKPAKMTTKKIPIVPTLATVALCWQDDLLLFWGAKSGVSKAEKGGGGISPATLALKSGDSGGGGSAYAKTPHADDEKLHSILWISVLP